jgi:hypothetical protein
MFRLIIAMLVFSALPTAITAQPSPPIDCAAQMAAKGYTGSRLFNETYRCETGKYPARQPDTPSHSTVPNDATLKRLQDSLTTRSD